MRMTVSRSARTAPFSAKLAVDAVGGGERGVRQGSPRGERSLSFSLSLPRAGFKKSHTILTPHARSRSSRANAAGRARLAGDKHAKLRFLGARRAVCEQHGGY